MKILFVNEDNKAKRTSTVNIRSTGVVRLAAWLCEEIKFLGQCGRYDCKL